MSEVISIVNAKGGTGKTTTAFNLGAAIANKEKRVLLIDNDSQASLTKAMGVSPSDCRVTLATLMCQAMDSPELLTESLANAILQQHSLNLIPANQKLSGVATRLSVMQATASMFSEQDDIQPVYVLKTIVDMLRPQYDYILIDCSPHPDLQMINALAASDEVIIPVQAHYLDAEGLPDTLELVRRVRTTYQPSLSVCGLLLTMYKGRTLLAKAVKEQIEEDYGTQIHVFTQPIDYSIRVAEHSAYGESLLDYAPDCPAAKSYALMAEEVLSHMLNRKKIRWIITPVLAALLFSAAGATQESEQVLLEGDQVRFEPISTEMVEINGLPTLTKTFELSQEVDPALLREEPFSQDGYWYRYQRMDKSDQETTDTLPMEETVTVEAPSSELADVIDQFTATRAYSKDGYTGELLLDVQSIKVEATGYTTVTDSHPHTVTKRYELAYNDRSLVPESVQSDGLTLPLTGLSWSETANVEDSDVPASRTATATYSRTTYTSRQVADGYQATAVYKGDVEKTGVESVIYAVTYTGSKIPVLPGLNPDITVSQIAIAMGLAVLLILLMIWRYIRWHIARVYVYNEERRIHDVVSRQYVRVRTPKLRLSALQGHEETEYTVILRRRLAKRLVGRDIAIETGGEGQHHVVESFVGSDYAFQVQI